MLAVSEGGTDHFSCQGSKPPIVGGKDDVARGIIDSPRKETQGHPVAMFSKLRLGPEKAMVASTSHFKDSRGRLPGAFLRHGKYNRAVRGHAGAIASTQSGGDRFRFGSGGVAGHPELGGTGKPVKATLVILMKREGETIAPSSGEFVGQALVEISFTIPVGIVQSCQLISPNHMDSIINHDQSERLVQTGCESFPN